MDLFVNRTESLNGEVYAPSSKGYTHRMLVAALLSKGTSKITSPLISDDTRATLHAIMAYGGKTRLKEGYWIIKGDPILEPPKNPIFCGDSGSTLRFMIPVAALVPNLSEFTLGSSLRKRPHLPLLQSLEKMGVESKYHSNKGSLLVNVQRGVLEGGEVVIKGNISSQFISGLLFACPKAEKNSQISINPQLESKNYVEMTLEILEKHGITVDTSKNFTRMEIPSNQDYKPCNHTLPGDFSSAAFLLVAAAITSSKLRILNLDYNTKQGDRVILDLLKRMGSKVSIRKNHVEIEGEELTATDINAKNIPDLVPICAVLASCARGKSTIFDAKRLRYKESDRLSSICSELNKMGAEISKTESSLIIEGPCKFHGATINPHNDHRIAMACTIAALTASSKTRIQDPLCVKKSYPSFYHDLNLLGANINGWK